MTFFAYPRARTWTLGVNVTFCIAYIYFLLLFDILKLHFMRIAMWVKAHINRECPDSYLDGYIMRLTR